MLQLIGHGEPLVNKHQKKLLISGDDRKELGKLKKNSVKEDSIPILVGNSEK